MQYDRLDYLNGQIGAFFTGLLLGSVIGMVTIGIVSFDTTKKTTNQAEEAIEYSETEACK